MIVGYEDAIEKRILRPCTIASARLTNALDTTARPLSYFPLADYVLSTTFAGEACSVQLKGELER
jgi:hypothetical protein